MRLIAPGRVVEGLDLQARAGGEYERRKWQERDQRHGYGSPSAGLLYKGKDCAGSPSLLHRSFTHPHTTSSPAFAVVITMSRTGTPGAVPSNTLLLRRQLAELTKHPVEGFSAGAGLRSLHGCRLAS